jgi:hypothetical protein
MMVAADNLHAANPAVAEALKNLDPPPSRLQYVPADVLQPEFPGQMALINQLLPS